QPRSPDRDPLGSLCNPTPCDVGGAARCRGDPERTDPDGRPGRSGRAECGTRHYSTIAVDFAPRASAVVRRYSPAADQAGATARRGQGSASGADEMRVHLRGVFAAFLGLALVACAQPRATDVPVQPGAPAVAVAPMREDTNSRFIGLIGTKAQHAPPFLG